MRVLLFLFLSFFGPIGILVAISMIFQGRGWIVGIPMLIIVSLLYWKLVITPCRESS